MAMESSREIAFFGGSEKWNEVDWTSSDDRIRGGKSQSYLECSPEDSVARFHGNLDIQTLGGAGFASQRTRKNVVWDLSSHDGIQLVIMKSDSKHYTFNIKDTLLPPDPDTGREQSTISYEYDFQIPENATLTKKSELFIPWGSFKATYRGRLKEDAPKLNTTSIRQLSIMMRSFFGEQEGAFSLSIESISAVCSGTEKEFAVVGVEEKRSVKAQSRDPIIYNNRSPPGFNATTLFCVGFCVVSAVILFAMSTSSSKKDVRNLYMKLRNGI